MEKKLNEIEYTLIAHTNLSHAEISELPIRKAHDLCSRVESDRMDYETFHLGINGVDWNNEKKCGTTLYKDYYAKKKMQSVKPSLLESIPGLDAEDLRAINKIEQPEFLFEKRKKAKTA